MRLGESDYVVSPDVHGNLEFRDVLPGPYDEFVIDTSLAAAGTVLGTPLRFEARRDSSIRAVLVSPPPEAFLFRRCASIPTLEWITAIVLHEDGTPFRDARWEAGEDFNTSSEYVYARGRTGPAGTFGFCSELTKGGGLQLRVSDGLEPRDEVVVALTAISERVKITLRARAAPTP